MPLIVILETSNIFKQVGIKNKMLNNIYDKKRLLLVILIAVVVIGFILIIILSKPSKPIPPKPPRPTATPFKKVITPTPSIPGSLEKKIEVSGITIDNIYKNPVEINKSGDVLFFKNDNYQFVYLPSFSKFLITILASPFWEKEKEAEEEFVRTLGITKEQACWLTVEISTPLFINREYAGKTFPLSFCMDI